MKSAIPHPAQAALADRGITHEELAAILKLSRTYVSHALNGRIRTSKRFRRAVSLILGHPESAVFLKEAQGVTIASLT